MNDQDIFALFKRTFGEQTYPEHVREFLALMVACHGPLPLEMAAQILQLSTNDLDRITQELHDLVEVSEGEVFFVPDILAEWLVDEARSHAFHLSASSSGVLANFLWAQYLNHEKTLFKKQVLTWLPHLTTRCDFVDESLPCLTALNEYAHYLSNHGKIELSLIVYMHVLRIVEIFHPNELALRVASQNNVANTLKNSGSYGRAKEFFEKSLSDCDLNLSELALDKAATENYLALLLRDQGEFVAAKALLTNALALRENLLGKDHLDVASTLNDLAFLMKEIGEYEEADVACFAVENPQLG